MEDSKSLAHTKWNCKYHIVFAPKYRRKVIFGKLKEEIGKILRELCNWKQVSIIEAEICPDHVHVSGNPTKDECIKLCRISERQEYTVDI